MMIDRVFFPPTRMRPLVLLRLSNSRRLFLGGSRGAPRSRPLPASLSSSSYVLGSAMKRNECLP
jgi:hypothetical protein